MQAGKELTGFRRRGVIALWKAIGHASVLAAKAMSKLGAHKQVAGRVLEPYSWCTQIFSATDVENLFTLRNHVDAEPHFHELARQMERQARIARETLRRMDEADITFMQTEGATAYQLLEPGEWHLPLVTEEELFELDIEEAKRVSAARCARTSYTLLGKLIPKLQEDLELCHKLFGSTPMHLSPTEHQAQATPVPEYYGNFRGFKQFRKEIPGENVDNGTRTVNSLGGVYINMEEVKLILDLNKGYILGKKPALFMKELQDAYENQN